MDHRKTNKKYGTVPTLQIRVRLLNRGVSSGYSKERNVRAEREKSTVLREDPVPNSLKTFKWTGHFPPHPQSVLEGLALGVRRPRYGTRVGSDPKYVDFNTVPFAGVVRTLCTRKTREVRLFSTPSKRTKWLNYTVSGKWPLPSFTGSGHVGPSTLLLHPPPPAVTGSSSLACPLLCVGICHPNFAPAAPVPPNPNPPLLGPLAFPVLSSASVPVTPPRCLLGPLPLRVLPSAVGSAEH